MTVHGIRPPNHVVEKFSLQGLICYKDTQRKAHKTKKLTKLTPELKM